MQSMEAESIDARGRHPYRSALRYSIYKSLEKRAFKGLKQEFLPSSAFNRLVTLDSISLVIQEDVTFQCENRIAFPTKIFQTCRKLFAICIIAKFPLQLLSNLMTTGKDDSHLPLSEIDCPVGADELDFKNDFLEPQYWFIPAFFELDKFHAFDGKIPIPIEFKETTDLLKGNGAFGHVWSVWIHPDHHALPCFDGNRFALKVCRHMANSTREKDFHDAMKNSTHAHLCKCLTHWTFSGDYYTVHELASCNLWELMASHGNVLPKEKIPIRWLLDQIQGLSGALRTVHAPQTTSQNTQNLAVPSGETKTGYIRDIKWENILCFPRRANCFRFSDFSCSRVAEKMLSKGGKNLLSHRTHNRAGTPTTRAPESHTPESGTSRPEDMWSFGCVLLDVLVWYYETYDGLEKFRTSRECARFPGGTSDDGFWYADEEKRTLLRPSVIEKIVKLSERPDCTIQLKMLLNVIAHLFETNPANRMTAKDLESAMKACTSNKNLTGQGLAHLEHLRSLPSTKTVPSSSLSANIIPASSSDAVLMATGSQNPGIHLQAAPNDNEGSFYSPEEITSATRKLDQRELEEFWEAVALYGTTER